MATGMPLRRRMRRATCIFRRCRRKSAAVRGNVPSDSRPRLVKEIAMSNEAKSGRHHRRLAGHRRSTRQSVPRLQLPGGRDGEVRQASRSKTAPLWRRATSRTGRLLSEESHKAWNGSGALTRSSTMLVSSSRDPSPGGRLCSNLWRQRRGLLSYLAAGRRPNGKAM